MTMQEIMNNLSQVFSDVKYHEKAKAFSGKYNCKHLNVVFILTKDKVRMQYNVNKEVATLDDIIDNEIASKEFVEHYRVIIMALEENRRLLNESSL